MVLAHSGSSGVARIARPHSTPPKTASGMASGCTCAVKVLSMRAMALPASGVPCRRMRSIVSISPFWVCDLPDLQGYDVSFRCRASPPFQGDLKVLCSDFGVDDLPDPQEYGVWFRCRASPPFQGDLKLLWPDLQQ